LKEYRIRRDVPDGDYPLLDIVLDFDKSPVIGRIFAEGKKGLEGIVVRVGRTPKYLRVLDDDGTISIGSAYLREGEGIHLYLDFVHEAIHVKQHRDGLPLYDLRYSYIDRPTEIEALGITVEEARRVGMGDRELAEYLDVPWITRDEYVELLRRLGIPLPQGGE
jgi:hypothetical protein